MMRAAVLEEIGKLRLKQVPVPEPGPGEVLVRIEANTICGTDLRIISGAKTAGVRPGVILGHEFAGRVAAVGRGVDGVPVGAQVTCSIVVSCQRCRACLSGREQLCENLALFGYELDGGLAEYLLVPRIAMDHGNLVVLEKEIPATTLALAEPWRFITTAFLHASPMHLAFNMWALWVLGAALEPALGRARSSVGASAVQSEWLSVVLLVGSLGLAWGRWPPTASIIFSMDYSIDEVDDISPAFRFRIPHTCVCRPRQGAPPMRSKPSALSVAISAVSTSSTVGVAGAISHWRDCAVEQRSV